VTNRTGEIGEFAPLGLAFLDVAFAEMTLSGVVGSLDIGGWLDLGYGYQGYFLGLAAGSASGYGQALADLF